MRYNFASVSKHFNVLIKGCFDPIVYYFIKPEYNKENNIQKIINPQYDFSISVVVVGVVKF